ncbi:MAG: thioesterase domain-containing protein [Gemmatimonadetes bacterium]|nr:thioesterase domain-containing protein [Gemmatimonadota bacterium]
MTPAELQEYLYENIPLARAMEVGVEAPGPEPVVLTAPLAPNTNHRSTAFGGSVSALATLAGWAAVHGRLAAEGRRAQVVIQSGTTDYVLPVRAAMRAVCDGVEGAQWDRLRRSFDRSGKGRAVVAVRVEVDGGRVARFEGAYVAIRIDDAGKGPRAD